MNRGLGGDSEASDNTRSASQRPVLDKVDATARTDLIAAPVTGPVHHPQAISVATSSDLNVLLAALAQTGPDTDLIIKDSSFQRSGSLKLIVSDASGRTMEITRSTIGADTILARTYHTGGRDALLIQDSTLNARQLIQLYAEGDSVVRFRGRVVLDSPDSKVAGAVVQVDPGGVVDSRGNIVIYTDSAQFNKPGRGEIRATGAQTVLPYEQR